MRISSFFLPTKFFFSPSIKFFFLHSLIFLRFSIYLSFSLSFSFFSVHT